MVEGAAFSALIATGIALIFLFGIGRRHGYITHLATNEVFLKVLDL